jgi:hypothetical protein
MAKKTPSTTPSEPTPDPTPGEPVPATAHRAADWSGQEAAYEPPPSRLRHGRTIAAIVIGALVIAGGSAAITASALSGAVPPESMAGMSGTSGSPSASAAVGPTVITAGFPRGGPGIFTDTCLRTKTAPDDPILMPGMPGSSMQHDFFGNTGTTASSVTRGLVGGSTSCTTSADASAYWTPVLFQNGTALTPKGSLVYWRAPKGAQASVQTVPAGLTMIAGNEAADAPQGKALIGWGCTGRTQLRLSDSPQDCASGSQLRLTIAFPNCWDGTTLGGSKQTNVVALTGTACPASHPVQIPQVVVHVVYPTSSTSGLTLSISPTLQGSVTTAHADFMNGWNEPVLTADVKACVVTGIRCGPVSGADATPRGGQVR